MVAKTRNEVIKGLEYCLLNADCLKCPLYDTEFCTNSNRVSRAYLDILKGGNTEDNVDQTFSEYLRLFLKKSFEAFEAEQRDGKTESAWYAKGKVDALKEVVETYASGQFRQAHSVCPFLKTTTITEVGTIEDFGACYGKECPFFVAGRCTRGK